MLLEELLKKPLAVERLVAMSQAYSFFVKHVQPNMSAWASQLTDERLAMNAVFSLYHLADHFWYSFSVFHPNRVLGANSSGEYRSTLAKRDPNFAILRDVAEAHKHVELNRNVRKLTYSCQTTVGSTGFGEGPYGTGPYGGGPSIVVTLNDKSRHHLSHIANKVFEMWESELG